MLECCSQLEHLKNGGTIHRYDVENIRSCEDTEFSIVRDPRGGILWHLSKLSMWFWFSGAKVASSAVQIIRERFLPRQARVKARVRVTATIWLGFV